MIEQHTATFQHQDAADIHQKAINAELSFRPEPYPCRRSEVQPKGGLRTGDHGIADEYIGGQRQGASGGSESAYALPRSASTVPAGSPARAAAATHVAANPAPTACRLVKRFDVGCCTVRSAAALALHEVNAHHLLHRAHRSGGIAPSIGRDFQFAPVHPAGVSTA